jgi:hypothetical protein
VAEGVSQSGGAGPRESGAGGRAPNAAGEPRGAGEPHAAPGELSAADITSMTIPAWEQAKAAMAAGDVEAALAHLDRAVSRWRTLQDYSINWITSLLSFIGRRLGEDAVEEALRATGDEFVRARRSPGPELPEWKALPAATRAKAIARAMVANFGECEVSEEPDRIVLSFRCGSGGRLIDEGRYDEQGGPFLTLSEPGPRTFGRDRLPVYCAHCSINNEIQPVEWGGAPMSIEFPSEGPGGHCIHHVYKDPIGGVPPEAWRRIGKQRPTPR